MPMQQEPLDLLVSGKRQYHQQSRQVQREEFEAQVVIHQLVFGDRGLADTLGPTWSMIHDPRFLRIENSFVRFRQGRLGGEASTGQTKQLPDGSFHTSVDDLDQYSEFLGEGRHMCMVLRSMAYFKAVIELWPQRVLPAFQKSDSYPGIYLYNQLPAAEQAMVAQLAVTYPEFRPQNLWREPDETLWSLIRQECPNYLNPHTGKFNQTAHQLHRMLRLDLVGLVADYAEIANLQEWVLLDDERTLVEDHHLAMNAPRIWAEVEMLERALTLRASLRSTAAQILVQMGSVKMIGSWAIQLTDFERDELLHLIYGSRYPDDQPELLTKIMEYLVSIHASGLSRDQREEQQCARSMAAAKRYVEELRQGTRLPINRDTDPGETLEMSDQDRLAEEILHDPIKQMLFLRWTGAEEAAAKSEQEEERVRYTKMAELLAPVFAKPGIVVTEDSAHALLVMCEELAPTRRLPVVEKDSSHVS